MAKRPPDRVLLVARNFFCPPLNGIPLTEIARLADHERCQLILYALSTVDLRDRGPLTYREVFGDSKQVEIVSLETGDVETDEGLRTEVWFRGERRPRIFYRRFAVSNAPKRDKLAFVNEIPSRMIDGIFWIICGEVNIINQIRATKKFVDHYEGLAMVRRRKPRLILNNWHTHCKRHEILKKQSEFSRGTIVLSVWCELGRRDPRVPWSAHLNGENLTNEVRELPRPLPFRPDVRAGVFDIRRKHENETDTSY
jgi:hypothetical protein